MLDPGPLSFTYTNVPVGAVSTQLIGANPLRYYLAVFNRSAEIVDLKENAPAVVGEGTPLNPVDADGNIQGWHEWSTHLGNLTRHAVFGITAGGADVVTVKEGFG